MFFGSHHLSRRRMKSIARNLKYDIRIKKDFVHYEILPTFLDTKLKSMDYTSTHNIIEQNIPNGAIRSSVSE